MKNDLYKEFVEIEKNNTIVEDSICKGIGIPRCDDGNIYYYGDITFFDVRMLTLPNNLVVYGCLNVNQNKIHILPTGLIVHGDFSCRGNMLTTLPDDIKIYGTFDCSSNKITSIPSTIYVKDEFFCGLNRLTTIPSNLNVGDIFCNGNKFKLLNIHHTHNIYVDSEYQVAQDRLSKINKLKKIK